MGEGVLEIMGNLVYLLKGRLYITIKIHNIRPNLGSAQVRANRSIITINEVRRVHFNKCILNLLLLLVLLD